MCELSLGIADSDKPSSRSWGRCQSGSQQGQAHVSPQQCVAGTILLGADAPGMWRVIPSPSGQPEMCGWVCGTVHVLARILRPGEAAKRVGAVSSFLVPPGRRRIPCGVCYEWPVQQSISYGLPLLLPPRPALLPVARPHLYFPGSTTLPDTPRPTQLLCHRLPCKPLTPDQLY